MGVDIIEDLHVELDDGYIYLDHPKSYDQIVSIHIEDIPKLLIILQQLYDSYILQNTTGFTGDPQ